MKTELLKLLRARKRNLTAYLKQRILFWKNEMPVRTSTMLERADDISFIRGQIREIEITIKTIKKI